MYQTWYLTMRRIIPITDLQRKAGQIITGIESDDPVIITHRGRPAAVLISADRYAQIEDDMAKLDELELAEMVARAREAIADGRTVSHEQVKDRFRKPTDSTAGRRRGSRGR
jgi:prevent-host-death family protein